MHLRNEQDEPAFIRQIQRIETKLARTADILGGPVSAISLISIGWPLASVISTSALARPPRVRSRMQWISMPSLINSSTSSERGAQRSRSQIRILILAHRHHGDAVPADVAAENYCVAIANLLRPDHHIVIDHADAGRVDEDTVTLSAIDYLCIAGDEIDTRRIGGTFIDWTMVQSFSVSKPSSMMKPAAQIQRTELRTSRDRSPSR